MDIINVFLLASLLITNSSLEITAANCEGKFELSRLSRGYHEEGVKNHSMVGHSFKNLTSPRIYDCHMHCFDEKCKCQAFQISGDRCELLDEDRFSAPGDFINQPGYAYFDMTREYINQVWVNPNK